jgi:hypothetical protein
MMLCKKRAKKGFWKFFLEGRSQASTPKTKKPVPKAHQNAMAVAAKTINDVLTPIYYI